MITIPLGRKKERKFRKRSATREGNTVAMAKFSDIKENVYLAAIDKELMETEADVTFEGA